MSVILDLEVVLQQQQRIKLLEKALQPFAERAKHTMFFGNPLSDSIVLSCVVSNFEREDEDITVGDLRNAARALEGKELVDSSGSTAAQQLPESSPMHAGRQARIDGKNLIDNPYERGSDEALDWDRGWKLKHWELLRSENPESAMQQEQIIRQETLIAELTELCRSYIRGMHRLGETDSYLKMATARLEETLARRAKSIQPIGRKPRVVLDDEVDLLLAWLKGEFTTGQCARAMGYKFDSQWGSRVASSLAKLCQEGKIEVKMVSK